MATVTTKFEGHDFTYTKTTYIALTTPFIKPPFCDILMRDMVVDTSTSRFLADFHPSILSAYDAENPIFASCVPPGGRYKLSPYGEAYQVVASPGVCPQDWETVYMTAYPTESGPADWFTHARCCPSGYTDASGGFYIRTSSFDFCTSTFNLDRTLGYTVTISDGPRVGEVTVVNTGMFVAPQWRILWKESDLPSLSPRPTMLHGTYNPYDEHLTTTSSTSTSTRASSYTYSSTSSSSATSVPASSASNLHAFVTIGLPIILLSITIGCISCWLFLKRKQRRVAVGLEAERLRMNLAESSEVQGVSEGLPVYTLHAPPVSKET